MSALNTPLKSTHSRPSFNELLTPLQAEAAKSKDVPNAPKADRKRERPDSAEEPQPKNLNNEFENADENGYDSGYDSPVPSKKPLVCPGAPMRPRAIAFRG